MDAREKYAFWEQSAQYDLDTAKAMLDAGRYLYVAFMCQQAIEKLAKGLYVLHTGEEPMRTHNIAHIYTRMRQEAPMLPYRGTEEEEKAVSLMEQLLYYYIAERYTDYKRKAGASLDGASAKRLLLASEEVFAWLQSLST